MPKYNSVETIPAQVFFSILITKDLQQLKPKSREKGLEDVFKEIYDDYFVKSDNDEAKEYLRLCNEINFLEYKIVLLKRTIKLYYGSKTTKQMRLDYIDALKEGFGIEINPELNFTDEVHRVITIELGIIENDLNIAKMDLESMVKRSNGKTFDYYDNIGVLSNILPNNSLLKERMSLATYISLEKLAKKVISEQNRKKSA